MFSEDFSAFVFKIQANMNKAHRDRLAFMRICSGKFERDTEYFSCPGQQKLRLTAPADDGRGAGDHRRGLRRGHHRRV